MKKMKKLNKEIKILLVVIFFTLVTYAGVETYAHSVMHKYIPTKNYVYDDLPVLTKTGNATAGGELVSGAAACTGCHGIKSQNIPAPMDAAMAVASYGVNPPDLSSVGTLYADNFLATLIKDPAKALKVEHKFGGDKMHPMTAFAGAGGDIDQEVADIIAYFKSIAPKELSNKQAYTDACSRCHEMRYAKITQLGDTPKFKFEKDSLAHRVQVLEYQDKLKAYIGKLPPDLSMKILSRGEHFMETFIEDPQSHLEGTSMPRVGLTKEGTEKVMAYMISVSDASKPARDSLGWKVILFFIIFSIIAYYWKRSIWSNLH